jgi:hypothetical protein
MAAVLGSCQLDSSPKQRTLVRKPRTNRYPSDSEDSTPASSEYNSESEYEISEDERVILADKLIPLSTSSTSCRPTNLAGPQNISTAPTNKPYVCSHVGCGKSYRKPSRLREHERSHTGEVEPIVVIISYDTDEQCRDHLCAQNVESPISENLICELTLEVTYHLAHVHSFALMS